MYMLEPQQRFPAPLQGYSGLGEISPTVMTVGKYALVAGLLYLAATKTKPGRKLMRKVRRIGR